MTPHSSVRVGRRIEHFHHEEWFVIVELNSMKPPEIILLHEVRFGRRQDANGCRFRLKHANEWFRS